VISQRVVAYLGAAGLQAAAAAATPDTVWTIPAAARLVAWTPEVPDPLLALEELAGLVASAGRDALARAGLESDPDRREALLHKAEAALRSQSILVPLAALPIGYRSRPGVHGISVDAGGRIRLEDAWVEP
jgi:hypothetical protein